MESLTTRYETDIEEEKPKVNSLNQLRVIANTRNTIGLLALLFASLSVDQLWSVPATTHIFGTRDVQTTLASLAFLYALFALEMNLIVGVVEFLGNAFNAMRWWLSELV